MSDYDYSWENNDVDYCDCCRIKRPVIDGLCRRCTIDMQWEKEHNAKRDDKPRDREIIL